MGCRASAHVVALRVVGNGTEAWRAGSIIAAVLVGACGVASTQLGAPPPREPFGVPSAAGPDAAALGAPSGATPWFVASSSPSSPPASRSLVTIRLLDTSPSAPPSKEACGLLPGERPEVPVYMSWDQTASCRARRSAWYNIPDAHVRCKADDECAVVGAACHHEALNRKAASLPRYRESPCGNPAAGACRVDPDLTAVCLRGCCRPGRPRTRVSADALRQTLEAQLPQWLATCGVTAGPDGDGVLAIIFDRDGQCVSAEASAPFQGSARTTCLTELARKMLAPYSQGGAEARLPFHFPPTAQP